MNRVITGKSFIEKLCDACGVDASKTQRIVIDASYDDVIRVYVQMIGTTDLLDVDFGKAELKVRVFPKAGDE